MIPVYASCGSFDGMPILPNHATLGTGGWLDLPRQGLSPCKKHQASLGAPMNKDEVPKKQKGSSIKTTTYNNQEITNKVKTPSFLGHLDPDVVLLIFPKT